MKLETKENRKKRTGKNLKGEELQNCEFCRCYSLKKNFIDGNGKPITWCRKCGESMLNALGMW